MTDGIKLIEGDCVTVMREFANESIEIETAQIRMEF